MYWTMFYIILTFFALGAVAIIRLNRTSDEPQRKARWVKYVFYLLVVGLTTACIRWELIYYLAIVILLIGGYEMVKGWQQSSRGIGFFIICLLIYLAIAICFYYFAAVLIMQRILFVYTIVFTFDGFAQITGQLFGKRKILPVVSPDKTVAGVVGGLIMGSLTGWFMMQWLHIPGQVILLSPVLICIAAFVGDALASLFKRNCGLKDYSRLIPGHGGILDRFDSFIFAGAVFWLFYL